MTRDSVPTAVVCAFVYDERPTSSLMHSLIGELLTWPELVYWEKSRDALIDRARSVVATKFLEQPYGEVLLMVDHDIGWEPGALKRLAQKAVETGGLVGGVYPMRGFGQGAALRLAPGRAYDLGADELAPAEFVSTGFIAIPRAVLERVAAGMVKTRGGFYPLFLPYVARHASGDEELSEDWAFCARAREAGAPIHADLLPWLTHTGSYTYTMVEATMEPVARVPVRLHVRAPDEPVEIGGGLRLLVDPGDSKVSATIMRTGRWEEDVLAALSRFARPDWVMWDAGAHVGYFTVHASRMFQRVVAVEPAPRQFNLLVKNIGLNDLRNVVAVRAALLDYTGKTRLCEVEGNIGASHVARGDSGGIEVDAVTFDALASDEGAPDLVKLDIEGAEWRALCGASALRHVKVLLTEYCEAQLERTSGVSGREYLAALREAGFTLRWLDGGLMDDARLPKGASYCDILAVREGG